MFRPVIMERVSAVLLGTDSRAALRRLGGAGFMQLIRAEAGPVPVPLSAPGNTAALGSCRDLIARAEEMRRELGRRGSRDAAARQESLSYPEAAAALAAIEAEVKALLERRRRAGEALAAAVSAGEKISPYAGLPLPSDRSGGFCYLRCFTGSLPSSGIKALKGAVGGKCVILALAESGGRSVVLVLADRDSSAALEEQLSGAGFRSEGPPSRPGLTLAEAAEYFSKEEKDCARARAELEAALEMIGRRYWGTLAAIESSAAVEARLLEAEKYMAGTSAAVILSGWVPAPEAGVLRGELDAATSGRFAAETSPGGPDAPVQLRPPEIFKPFLELIKAYGLPAYGEVDPTPFAAVAYVLMFGAMFGDVGHGAVLCVCGCLAASGRGRLRAAGGMAAYCGLSGIFFGFMYGSFFGVESFRRYALWRDPLEGEPLTMVLAAMAAGAVIISFGVVLNIINRAAAGDLPGAALDRFGGAGLLFYWCAILLLAGKIKLSWGLPVLGAALTCWALKEPLQYLSGRVKEGGREGGLAAVAAGAVGALEGVLLYLANTVSFARLAAYAMSHAALLAAAYMLAAAADKARGPGSAAGLLIIIAGNAAAIALEGTVAAVQALRLEYYEFFGKFTAGAGRPFEPFVLDAGAVSRK